MSQSVWRCPRVALVSLWLAILLLGGCALPPVSAREPGLALSVQETAQGGLGRAVRDQLPPQADLSGFYPLNDPYGAFLARAVVIQAADYSLDLQYYIWRGDSTGTLLLHLLHQAAERGVRVRLLLDDNGISGLDPLLQALDSHPLIEIRLFNPFTFRAWKPLNFLTDFSRLNRRMHNKAMLADNQVAIVGGRNIGNEYFGGEGVSLFEDLDVLAIGPIVEDTSADFDRYWASQLAYPLTQILGESELLSTERELAQLETLASSAATLDYIEDIQRSPLRRQLLESSISLVWAPARLVSDAPEKALNKSPPEALLSAQLRTALGAPRERLTMVSPYFVPTEAGVSLFRELESQGVEIRVLTNSLAANDVGLVHAGYARYREDLLSAGVELFELKPLARPKEGEESGAGIGSSTSSLHAKTFAVDGERLFVGSFNFDPRSTHLNTELGFLIDSPELAQRLEHSFDGPLKHAMWKLSLDENRELVWSDADPLAKTFNHDPHSSWLQRVGLRIIGWLPIEPLL